MNRQTTRLTQRLSPIILGALALITLSSCSQQLERQTCVPLADGLDYCLIQHNDLPLLATQTGISLSQMVRFEQGDEQHELMTQLEIDPQQMTLVGLAPLGQALFTLVYQGNTLTSQQSSLLGERFKAEYLMTMMQLIYWPVEQINRQLTQGEMTESACGAYVCRRLQYKQQTLIQIQYSHTDPWTSQVILRMQQANLSLHITPLI